MLGEPVNKISLKGLKVWRITGWLYSLFVAIIISGIVVVTIKFHLPKIIMMIAIVLLFVSTILMVQVIPSLRWRKWRYEVREDEVEIQQGIFIMKRTLIPMVRVQHVDTKQGPLLRKYNLASISITTAATTHEIPALEMEEAEELRFFISNKAKVAEDDV